MKGAKFLMDEKKYLKWYNKVGYGSGDLAGNMVYAFLSSFVMLYLTNTVGLNPGIVGTLIMVSKLFDGIFLRMKTYILYFHGQLTSRLFLRCASRQCLLKR